MVILRILTKRLFYLLEGFSYNIYMQLTTLPAIVSFLAVFESRSWRNFPIESFVLGVALMKFFESTPVAPRGWEDADKKLEVSWKQH